MLTVKQLASYLEVHIDTVLDAVQEGTIPHIQSGSNILFSKQAIDKWMEEDQIVIIKV